MKFSRSLLMIFLAALIVSALGSITPAFGQTKKEAKPAQAETQQAFLGVCPMHPDVTSNKPGKCPKCGMALVKKQGGEEASNGLSAPQKMRKAKALLDDAKRELAQQGKYSCCIEDGCNSCALQHQSCPCYESLKAGKHVCNECFAGWQRGEGIDKNVKKDQVKTDYRPHKH